MQALQIYAGPKAKEHIQINGLQPEHIAVIPGAAGGPKGLILGPLDRFIFGKWLARSRQSVDLVGASIGAWRMATACMAEPEKALLKLEHDYIHQDYVNYQGHKANPAEISEAFRKNLNHFYGDHIQEVMNHSRYRLHVITSLGKFILNQNKPWRMSLGYMGAFITNAVHRPAMSFWLERVVFSSPFLTQPQPLPFATHDYKTQQVALSANNFMDAIQGSCSIPFVTQPVIDIAGAPSGPYWDGGITDYHLHLDYRASTGLTLYPHFQKEVIPGWLDKKFKHRHGSTAFLDKTILLAPNPDWVKKLPNGKLPDRFDFRTYGHDLKARVQIWQIATSAAVQMAEEFEDWLRRPDLKQVLDLA